MIKKYYYEIKMLVDGGKSLHELVIESLTQPIHWNSGFIQ